MSAPLAVNTLDGRCWTRREGTRGGEALYAPEKCGTCPQFVMVTLTELAEQGIAGSADVLPMPVGVDPQPVQAAPLSAEREREIRSLDLLALMDDRVAPVVSGHLAVLLAEIDRLRDERHSTNESVDTASAALRVQRDRIAALEAMEQRLLAALPTEPRQTYGLPNDLAATAAEWGAWEQVAEALGVQLPYEHPVAESDVTPQVTKLRALLAGQRAAVEDPHDGPLHHSYRVGRDLPEMGGAL